MLADSLTPINDALNATMATLWQAWQAADAKVQSLKLVLPPNTYGTLMAQSAQVEAALNATNTPAQNLQTLLAQAAAALQPFVDTVNTLP